MVKQQLSGGEEEGGREQRSGRRELEQWLPSPADIIGLKNYGAQVVERRLSGGDEEGRKVPEQQWLPIPTNIIGLKN